MAQSNLNGQVAVITGGGRGIGRAAAVLLAEKGAAVVTAARSAGEIEETARIIQGRGGQSAAVPTNVAEWQQAQRLSQETERAFGPADVLVVNAGVVQPFGMTWDTVPEEWANNINVNLIGAYYTVRAFLPAMVARAKGTIILVSSGAANHPFLGLGAYASAKAGLNHFARNLSAELAEQKIPLRVYILQPGVVDTRMQATMRGTTAEEFPAVERFREYHTGGVLRAPEEPAKLIYWLAASFAADLTGQIISIDDPVIRKRVAEDLGAELTGR